VHREVSHRLKRDGNPLLDMVRAVNPAVDEQHFHDALTANLRRGRFLLLIVGDGIREGVEAIAEYLQVHSGLHFSLGLVEKVRADELQRFWSEFLEVLKLDDPEQPRAKPTRGTNIKFPLPPPVSWLSVYRLQNDHVGVFLSSTRNTPGRYAMKVTADDFDAIKDQRGGSVTPTKVDGQDSIIDWIQAGPMDQLEERQRVFSWLAERVNTFVRVLRPRMRSAAADYQSRGE
jgi:hypothetical protein